MSSNGNHESLCLRVVRGNGAVNESEYKAEHPELEIVRAALNDASGPMMWASVKNLAACFAAQVSPR